MLLEKNINNPLKSETLRAGIILLIFINLGNLLSYIYQFVMARMLGPVDYGVLAVLIAIAGIFGIPTSSIQTVISKHTTFFNIRKDYSGIKGILNHALKKVLLVSIISFLVYCIFAIPLSVYLKINYGLLAFTGLFIFGSFLYPINAGIMQGMKKFIALGFVFFINCFFKLILGILLVYVGLKVYGAAAAFIIGVILSFILSFLFIREITKAKAYEQKIKILDKKSIYAFGAMMIFVLMYSVDVIFAKGFFSPEIAGKYAVISMIGKIMLFVNMAITSIMFPINTEKFLRGDKSRGVIVKSLVLVLIICIAGILISFLLPEFTINLLFGDSYSGLANILLYVVTAFAMFSILNALILYRISREEFRLKALISLTLIFLVQISTLIYFGSNVNSFAMAMFISSLISLIGGLILIKE